MRELQQNWHQWRQSMDHKWGHTDLHYAAKVAEEAGEVLGAVLKSGQPSTHGDTHGIEEIRKEIGQLQGTLHCLAERYGIDPEREATRELSRVQMRFRP